jgi:hypothetical protein
MRRRSATALAVLLAAAVGCDADRPLQPRPAAAPSLRADPSDPTPRAIALAPIGRFEGGGPMAAEIPAYDDVSKRLFVVNGALGTVDVLDLRDPSAPRKIATLAVSAYGGSANSVAAHGGIVAVAVGGDGAARVNPGTVVFYRATTLQEVSSVEVGALPDMLTFTPDGRTVLVANEGEPNDGYTVDPEGSVSIIDVSNVNRPTVRTADFRAFNGQEDALRARGVRIFGANAPTAAQDLEPEYVAVSDDGRTAWVTLQENNAVAVVDVAAARVTDILPLGYKDHRQVALDANDRDGVNIRTWPVPLFGMYQPDAIAAYTAGGQTYLVTANEGDARAYPGFDEEVRVSNLPLNTSIFTSAACGGVACTNSNAALGRLTVTRTLGRNATTGRYDALYAFGARSISIWTATGEQVWDSGDAMEQRTRNLPNVPFNASNTAAGSVLDDRSDNKGPEPEGVVVGRLGAKTYAFVGLERTGGVMVWDVTTPAAPQYVTYVNPRQGGTGDLGPEGLTFVPAKRSPNKRPLLIVGNEVSGTTTIYQIELL